MAKISGKYLVVQSGGTAYTAITASVLNLDGDMIDVTNADSAGGWKEFIRGEQGGTIQVDGLYDQAATEGFSQAFADLVAGTSVTWKYGETTSGTKFYTGSALISNVGISGDKNDAATYTCTLQITGAVTEGTNT